LLYSIRHASVGLAEDFAHIDEFNRGRVVTLEQIGHRLTDIVKEAYKRAYAEKAKEVSA